MFCKHCGSQLDNDSAFCSACGKKLVNEPENKQADEPAVITQRKLFVQRKKHIYGCAVTLGILVDGVEQARVSNGGEAAITISSESHAINIKQDNFGGKYKSQAYIIEAGTGDVYGYIKPPLFGDKWTITFAYK